METDLDPPVDAPPANPKEDMPPGPGPIKVTPPRFSNLGIDPAKC